MRGILTLVLGGLLAAALAPAQAAMAPGFPPPPPELAAETGLPAGEPETLLPAGAVVHLRLNNPRRLLADLDRLVLSFVPRRILPPDLAPLLQFEHPVLALITGQAMGQPLTPDELEQLLGLDLDGPITLTFYPESPERGFVLSLPIGDRQAFNALAGNLLSPRAVTPPGAEPFTRVRSGAPDLPRQVFIAAGPDRAYFCGSPELAGALSGPAVRARLGQEGVIARSLADHADADLLLALDPSFIQPQVARLLDQYGQIPPEVITDLRRGIGRGLPPEAVRTLNMRLRAHLGVADVEEGLDYLECLATAAWEVLVPWCGDQLLSLEGVALAVDLGGTHQRAALSVYSERIAPDPAAAPVPLDAVRPALTILPGERSQLAISGRQAPPSPSPLLTRFLEQLREKLLARRLNTNLVDAYVAYRGQRRLTAPLEARTPWSLSVAFTPPPAEPEALPATTGEYLQRELGKLFAGRGDRLLVMPVGGEDLLAQYYSERAEDDSDNDEAWRAFLERAGLGQPFFDYESRFRVEETAGPARRFVLEHSYTTSGGLFGYSEHELINRRVLYARTRGGLAFLQSGEGDDSWLNRMEEMPVAPVPPALERLLALVPDDARWVSVGRVLNQLDDLVAGLDRFELTAHREMTDFLARANAVAQMPFGEEQERAVRELEARVPALMLSLNRGWDGKLYLTLPGNLRFPRPRVVPALSALLADFFREQDNVGGAVMYSRETEGRYDLVLVQSTEALSLLVRTTVDNFQQAYLADRAGQQRLRALLQVPGDGRLARHEIIMVNMFWGMFLR